jgi:hypothetical protein
MVQAVSRRSQHHGPGSNPGQICGENRDIATGFYLRVPHFSLSVSLHQWSALIFIMLLLPEGQTGEAWEPSKTQCSFVNRGTFDRKIQ